MVSRYIAIGQYRGTAYALLGEASSTTTSRTLWYGENTVNRICLTLTLTILLASAWAAAAFAFPVVPMDLSVANAVLTNSDRLTLTYEGTAATYSNDLYLMRDSFGGNTDDGDLTNDLFLFNNHSSAIGSTFDIDNITSGSEMLFRLFVHDTGYNFYSGVRTRNFDRRVHAMFQSEWKPGYSLVSFEDLYGTPQYGLGYNDLSFSFRNTRTGEVPEPWTASLLLGGMAGMLAFGRRRAR